MQCHTEYSSPSTHASTVTHHSKINTRSRPSNIGAPVVIIDRVLLIDVHLKEPIMLLTSIVFVPAPHSQLQFSTESCSIDTTDSRVQLLHILLNEPLLCDLEKSLIRGHDEVALAFQRTVIDLPNELHDERRVGQWIVWGRGGNGTGFGERGPGHEDVELAFVGCGSILEGADARAAEDRRHCFECFVVVGVGERR